MALSEASPPPTGQDLLSDVASGAGLCKHDEVSRTPPPVAVYLLQQLWRNSNMIEHSSPWLRMLARG